MSCLAQMSTPQYGVKESEAPTGSNIKRYVASGSRIPVNRTYAELSADEKAFVSSFYEKMGPGDEPPFPIEGLRPIYSAIAKVQQKLLVTGKLTLVASVDPTGTVTEVQVIESPSKAMTQAAASVVVLAKFKPALCANQPCKMEFPFNFAFAVR